MVLPREWMFFLLVALRSSKASERLIEGWPTVNGMQDEIMHDSIQQLDKGTTDSALMSEHKPDDNKSSSGHELIYGYHHKQEDFTTSKAATVPVRLKAEIYQKLTGYQEQLSSIKSKGGLIKTLFDFFEANEKLWWKYGHQAEGKRISDVLVELKEIRRSIKQVIQICLLKKDGFNEKVSEPAYENEANKLLQVVHEPMQNDVEVDPVVPQPQSIGNRITTSDSGSGHLIIESPTKSGNFQNKEKPGEVLDSTEKNVEAQEAFQSESHNHILDIVHKRMMEKSFDDLIEILHSITFPEVENIETSEVERNPIRKLKVGFEGSLLQEIQLMDEFGFIGKRAFENFVSDPWTLEFIGNHLVDLFHVIKHGTWNHPLSLIPDMDFLCKHPQTMHLHKILISLQKEQQGQVLYKSLMASVSLYGKTIGGGIGTPRSAKIRADFLNGKFLTELKGWKNQSPNAKAQKFSTESTLKNSKINSKNILDHFRNPNVTMRYTPYQYVYEAEYHLNYHILRFIEKYYEGYFDSLFDKPLERETLMKQLKLFQEGIKADQLLKQGSAEKSVTVKDDRSMNSIPEAAEKFPASKYKEDFEITSYSYKRLSKEIEELSHGDSDLRIWYKGVGISRDIIKKFDIQFNRGWEKGMLIEEMKREQQEEFDQSIMDDANFNEETPINKFVQIFRSMQFRV